jgi:hypothetical protein
MGSIHGANRHDVLVFPERLDDDITEDHPVRCIDAFVDALDLAAGGFQAVNANERHFTKDRLTKLRAQIDARSEADLNELDRSDECADSGGRAQQVQGAGGHLRRGGRTSGPEV